MDPTRNDERREAPEAGLLAVTDLPAALQAPVERYCYDIYCLAERMRADGLDEALVEERLLALSEVIRNEVLHSLDREEDA